MPLPLDRQNALPISFPVGARYVVEGRGGKDGRFHVSRRYVVLPGGRRIDVPAADAPAATTAAVPARQHGRKAVRSSAAKKIASRAGTTRQ
jgi:hypothetical protein